MMYLVFLQLMMIRPISSQLLLLKNDIEVPIGREVFLKPIDLQFYNVALDEVCKVEVVPNEPMFQRVGLLEPQIFDCSFKYGSVKYTHHGSHLLKNDIVKLRVFKFLKKDTLSEFFDLNFVIKEVPYDIVQFRKPLIVNEFFGLTHAIDDSVIGFNYSRSEGAICKVRLSRYLSYRPAYGQIVIGREKRPIDVIKRRCNDFLHLGLLYKHLKPPTPNIDFVLVIVEVSDPLLNGGELVTEWFHIPVEIRPGFPNLPPKASFSGMYLMDVDQFIITTITSSVLSGTDSETPSEQLIFNISRPLLPHQGFLVHLSDHSQPIHSFRHVDLNNFDIAYKPPTKAFKERQMFNMSFVIFDGDFTPSDAFTLYIAIRPSVTKAPRVAMNTGMVLLEGQSRPIRLKNLEIVDSDNLDDVEIFVTGGLRHGKLEVGKKSAESFTQQDIEAGRVVYHHDESDSVKDSIHFRVYDGIHSTHVNFPITIIPKDDNPPNLIVNVGLKVDEGEDVIVTPDVLRAIDQDSSEDLIMFIVKKGPIAGVLQRKFSWEKAGTVVKEFSQRDVNKGLIYYHHNGNEVFLDNIDVVLQDSQSPPNTSPLFTISIHITPVGDDPPKRDSASSFSIILREVDVGVLSSKHLRYMDVDSNDQEIIYIITEQPRFIGSFALSDPGKIVSIDNQVVLTKDLHLPAIANFTQEQVNHHKIAYIPPLDDIGPNQLYLQCAFAVTDKHQNTITGQILNITLLPVNNQIPQLHTGRLFVEEGASTLLSTNELSVYDPDTLRTDLQMSLFTIPLHGSLRRSSQPLRVGDLLSLDDILTLRLEYIHDGTESFKDSFKVGVNDGLHFVAGEVLIEIEPVDDEIPIWLPGILQQMFVNEGGSTMVLPQVLAATDFDTNDELLYFILTKVPHLGYILANNRKVNMFTQRDVMNGDVKYVHNGQEIGPKMKNDTMIFIVTDKTFPRLASHLSHKVVVSIIPQNTQKPRISFKRAVLVSEGLRTAVTEDNLMAVDDDTQASELIILVKTQPQFGFLENLRPTPGFEASNRGKGINAFTMWDVKNGFVVFSQAIHKGVEPESDSFEVFVTDGLHNSSSVLVLVSILLQNDEEPTFDLSNITVSEGEALILDNSIFSITDRDFPGDILIIGIKSKPMHGTLMHMVRTPNKGPVLEVPFREATVENFKDVVYRHDGSETSIDSFSLSLSDGVHKVARRCYVEIIPVNDEMPHIVKNIPIQNVELGDSVLLSGRFLLVEDVDTLPEELVFKVLTTVRCGILQRRNSSSTTSDEDYDWELLDPLEFTQLDVSLNLVRYLHNLSSPDCYADNFTFVVSDGSHETTNTVFRFELVDIGKSNLTVVVNSVAIEENEIFLLNSSMLQAFDGSPDVKDIMFHVLKSPVLGTFHLVSNSIIPIKNFSLVKLLNNQVIYKHNSSIKGNSDAISLMVTNGVIEKNITFLIDVMMQSIPELPTLEINLPINIDLSYENSSIITANYLFSTDPTANDIIYFIVKKPQFGEVYLNSIHAFVKSFGQDDVNQDFVMYKTNRTGLEFVDSFFFTVSNGKTEGYLVNGVLQNGTTEFKINVKPKPPVVTVPILHIMSPDKIEIVWNGHLGYVLHNTHLKASFPGMSAPMLRFYVIKYLQHGYIFNVLNEKVVRTFTQEDVNKRSIVIILKQVSEVRDFFTFNVAAGQVTYNHGYRMDFYWAAIFFPQPEYFVCEDARVLNISIHRTGNLNTSSFANISAISQTAREGLDYVAARNKMIQFDPGSSAAFWIMIIIQDHLEEAPIEQVQVILSQPENAVIGSHNRTLVSIYDLNRGSCSQIPSTSFNRRKPGDSVVVKEGFGYTESEEDNEDLDEGSETSTVSPTMVCDQNTYRFLQYNHTARGMYECNGREWIPWVHAPNGKPASTREFMEPTDGTTVHEENIATKSSHTYAPPSPVTTPEYRPFEVSCGEGWHLFDGDCHRFHRQQSTWSAAQKICQGYNKSHLVVVKSQEHNEWLVQLARSKPFWIGLHALPETNTWNYDTSEGMLYSNWKKGFPRLPPTGEMKHKCVLVRGSGFWINRHCEFHEHSFICALYFRSFT